MKKVIILLSVLFFSSSIRAFAQNDTVAILQTMVTNKSSYIGQPFSYLISQLPIQVQSFMPLPGGNNRYKERLTSFSFYNTQQLNLEYRTYPMLQITWQAPINRSYSQTLWRQTNGAWSSTISSHYSTWVISDISIIR